VSLGTSVDPDLQRLDPRVRTVWVLKSALAAALLGGGMFAVNRVVDVLPWYTPLVLGGLIIVVGVTFAVLRYRAWGYEVRNDGIYLERGVLTQVRTVVPFVRIQHVDSSRSPVERLAGLATTVVYTAGSRGADVTVPGLTPVRADDLRERLKQLAIRSEGEDAV
jgi:membrane protein YdbS with pleckstrin-like domain